MTWDEMVEKFDLTDEELETLQNQVNTSFENDCLLCAITLNFTGMKRYRLLEFYEANPLEV